jgi:hypothetical protein
MEEDMSDRPASQLELDHLLHPAQAFDHPTAVLRDPDLTLNEKRAILAAWASDACAIEAAPELRSGPAGAVKFDEIMDALRELDKQAAPAIDRTLRKGLRQRIFRRDRGREGEGEGQPLQ